MDCFQLMKAGSASSEQAEIRGELQVHKASTYGVIFGINKPNREEVVFQRTRGWQLSHDEENRADFLFEGFRLLIV